MYYIFFFVFIFLMNHKLESNQEITKEQAIINKCMSYPLTHVIHRFTKSIATKNNGTSAELVELFEPAALELKRFFALAALYPQDTFVMTHKTADLLWHTFFESYPEEYKEFCQKIVGRCIEHKPITQNDDKDKLEQAYLSFKAKYKTIFGVSAKKNGWVVFQKTGPELCYM